MAKNIILTESQFRDYIDRTLDRERKNPNIDQKIEQGNFNLDNTRFAIEEENFSKFGLEPDPKTKEKEINQSWNEFNKMNKEPFDKVTPEMINSLKPNEIFVFGSNLKGLHAGGAARFALDRFGAEWGNGVGMQGQSYAIPTLSNPGGIKSNMLPISVIGKYVNEFLQFANEHKDLVFLVTPIGCGIAGFTPEDIAPLFRDAMQMNNVTLPQSFIDILEPDKENLENLLEDILDPDL